MSFPSVQATDRPRSDITVYPVAADSRASDQSFRVHRLQRWINPNPRNGKGRRVLVHAPSRIDRLLHLHSMFRSLVRSRGQAL